MTLRGVFFAVLAVVLLSLGGCDELNKSSADRDADRCRAVCAPRGVAEVSWIGSCTCSPCLVADGGAR